jgi:hypothetical protein
VKKYAVHPGFVISRIDGDKHFINSAQLARLYELDSDEYIVWNEREPRTYLGRREEDYIHLYPRYDGNYGRPNA